MPQEGFKRKLTAILSADVVGYSRLMAYDYYLRGVECFPISPLTKEKSTLARQMLKKAIDEQKKAIALSPNDVDGIAGLGGILTWTGRPEETIGLVMKAMRLNPIYQTEYLWNLGHAYYLMGRYQEAIGILKRARDRDPDYLPPHVYLAASYSNLGQEDEAWAEASEYERLSFQTPIEAWRHRLPYKNQAVLEHLFDSLRKAGLK
jgi:tetratricopeptide (TPR) repeat protein